MSGEALNQAQIDALLNGGAAAESAPAAIDLDAVGEIGNIAFGTAATTLSMLLNRRVAITTPQVSIIEPGDADTDYQSPYVAAEVEYVEGLQGVNMLAITSRDAAVIADLMLGGDGTSASDGPGQLSEMHLSAVAEAMNQMMGSAATSLSTMLKHPVNISPPKVSVVEDSHVSGGMVHPPDVPKRTVKVSFELKVGDLIDSRIMHVSSLEFAADLVRQVVTAGTLVSPPAAQQPSATAGSAAASGTDAAAGAEVGRLAKNGRAERAGGAQNAPRGASDRAGVLSEAEQSQLERLGATAWRDDRKLPGPIDLRVETAEFSPFEEHEETPAGRNLDLLLDISLGVTVELGRTRKLIRDILDLAKGSIVELDTVAGEPVDILVNEKLIARGEVVVIDENFGVRVTDVVSPAERLRRLR